MLQLRHTDDSLIEVGIDEAGRGSLWGPLYAAAVIWPMREEEMSDEQKAVALLIKDSKKLSHKRRIHAANLIKDFALAWGVGSVSAQEIDEIGITRANQLAFERALETLSVTPERLLIDGCLSIYQAPWSMIPQVVEPEADGKYLTVAAASILAKVSHDEWVQDFCDLNENVAETYDLKSCKGYGTQKHRDGILKYGKHSQHRNLFLRKLLGVDSK